MPAKGSSEGYVFFNKQRKKWNAQYIDYDIKTGKVKKRTKSFKTEEEAKKYLSTIMYQKENPLYIEHHGIPLCEILKQNLKLKFETNQIALAQYGRITRSIQQLEKSTIGNKNIDTITSDEKGNIIMGNKTKTYAGKRILPIPNFLYPYIIEQMQIANNQKNNDENLLFKPNNSKYCRRSTINNELKRIFKIEFGITDISSHSLRHTFGTRCIESGMAPVVVQRLMGHKNIAVTLNTYTSVFDKYKERELDKVNQYYLNENLIENNLLSEKGHEENER